MSTKDVIGFMGLGAMGTGMAHNLHAHLQRAAANGGAVEPALRVYNRSAARAGVLVNEGAVWVDSPGAMAGEATIVFTMLAEDQALRQVFSQFLSGKPRPGTLFIDCSTVYTKTTEELTAAAEEAGIGYLCCPVFGRPEAARERQLLVIAAGKPDLKAKAEPYLQALGRAVLDVGDTPAAGSVMKLVGNFFIGSTIEAISEGMTLGDKAGLPRDCLLRFFDFMFPSPIYKGYGSRIAHNKFIMDKNNTTQMGFTVELGMKDVGHVQRLGRDSQAPVPIADLIMEHMKEAVSKGRGDLDWSAVATVLRDQAGMADQPIE